MCRPEEDVTEADPEAGVPCRFPAGYYYSPMPDARELAREPRRSQVWSSPPRDMPGVDWNAAYQGWLCREVLARQERLDLASDETEDPTEYYTGNMQYPALDAWLLEGMLRYLRPRRLVEVGSGFSSLVTARVNRQLLGASIDFTCIEPYPRDFLVAGVPGISALRTEQVQDTPLEVFQTLADGDVLFIDTSHVVKTGNDVVFLYHEVLPRLHPGVVVHIHDVFLPGDYPEAWVMEGWGWNEIYLLQSFLAFNSAYEVMLGAQYMAQRQLDVLLAAVPGFAELDHSRRGGGALWIRRRF